ncbi:MAG: hypothetical protein IJH47_00815 [Oscillospiraceae bacterium]|nr:hypothetical protein [Oscillospiraceae bacterium]
MLFEIPSLWYGLLGFGSILLYDINNVNHNNDRLQSLYGVGGGLIGLAVLDQINQGVQKGSSTPLWLRIVFGVLAAVFFVLLVYATLFAGKRTRWGRQAEKTRWWEKDLADRGLFALCRHPAVWLMLLMNLCLMGAVEFDYLVVILFNTAGLLLAFYEDRYVFPELMKGYENYRKTTPFLLPTGDSIRRCRETWKKNKEK